MDNLGSPLTPGRRCLCLDFDGTLADSLGLLRDVYGRFLETFARQGTDAEFERLKGPPLGRVVALLQAAHGLPGPLRTLQERYLAMITEGHRTLRPTAGAEQLLRSANAAEWTIVVVTSAPHAITQDWLEKNHFAELVTHVVGGDDVVHGKPHPGPYLRAVELADSSPNGAWAVEDSRAGARSAVAAGLRTFILETDGGRDDWPAGVTFIARLDDLVDLLQQC